MTSTAISPPLRRRSALATLLAALFALLMMAGFMAPASAATDDQSDDANYSFRVQGNVRSGGEPVQGVSLVVTGTADGAAFENRAETDENGRYQIGVPVKDGDWKVELIADSLPAELEVPDTFAFEQEVTFGAGSSVTKNFVLTAAERSVASVWDQFASRAVNGLNFGLMLALAAIGLSLVYGTTGLSNFAHGEMVTFGALAALLLSQTGLPIIVAIVLAVGVSAGAGWALDSGLWQPLRKKGLGIVQVMIVSIGLSLAVRYAYQMIIGGDTVQLGGRMTQAINIGPVRLSYTDMLSMGISIVAIVALAWWLLNTRVGKATRAVSDNPSLAAASGINVDRVIRIVWILGSALAGLSGVLWAWFRPGLRWDMGTQVLLLMFAAVTLGGLGSAWGALVGSLIVGFMVEVSTLWIPSDLKYVGALVVLIVVLLFRPQGILGRKERIG